MAELSDKEKVDDNFCKRMRRATREVHAASDALVNAKLAFGFSNNLVWADGLLVFYEIFRYLEEAMDRLHNTKVGELKIATLCNRTDAFEQDLEFYLGRDWKNDYKPRESVEKYLLYLRKLEETDSLMLIAYIYHLYMGLLSGGIILRKKRQLMQRVNPFQKKDDKNGNMITDFGDCSIYNLKSEFRKKMNDIAKDLDNETKNKLIEESKTVFILNNTIIRSVKGAGSVVAKKIAIFSIVVASFAIIYFRLSK